MSHRTLSEDLIELVVCRDHFQRVEDGNPCEDCPSRPENMDRAMQRAETAQIGYRRSVKESHIQQERLLLEIRDGLKNFRQTYLALCSVAIFIGLCFLLWNNKIQEWAFLTFSAAIFSPFYGSSMAMMIRGVTKSKGAGAVLWFSVLSAFSTAAMLLLHLSFSQQ